MGIISTVSLSLPIIILAFTGLYGYRSFPALLLFYILAVGNNLLTEGYINANPVFVHNYGIINNLLETPLILLFLTYFSHSTKLNRQIRMLIGAIIIYEAIIVAMLGFTVKAITVTIGSGLLLVLAFCIPFFMRQIRNTIMYRKATGKAAMISALLFSYGCFAILYLIFYVFKTQYRDDAFLVFFLATTLSSILMSIGIFIERKRVQKLNELLTTRKELSLIYNETKTATPLKAAILDFDKNQWN
jgi:hypothetical protein